ncbi:MAG: GAF domain-containing protein [Leptolyngbyaceae cyanobacterium]
MHSAHQNVSSQPFEVIQSAPSIDAAAEAILSNLGQQLACDRAFLYVRSPESQIGKVPFCWRRTNTIPLIQDVDWKPEPSSLSNEDPMFAAALKAEPSVFIEDVETASPDTLNQEFERKTFGHRALVHGHLCVDGQLWGILQPCIFDRPRQWTKHDRQLIQTNVAWLTPLAIEFVKLHLPNQTCS